MNPLLSSRNLFILRSVNPRKSTVNDLLVINEFDGFINYIENQIAMNVFGDKKHTSRAERTKFARELLIEMIGEDEFNRIRELLKKTGNSNKQKWQYSNLDKTERIILKLIAKGFTQTEIAELLDLTKTKVKDSKKCIYEKMNFINTNDLLLYASKNNLV